MPFIDRLGEFYLGRRVSETMESEPTPYLYTSSDLTTHAMIVGMTGSGKTGLGIDLLEEAILDGLPALIIDPKGDMTNLLLADPALTGERLATVIAPQVAQQAGMSLEDFAAQEAARWTNGWATAGIDASRVAQLAQSDRAVYTPGDRSGTPLSLYSFAEAPPVAVVDDAVALSEAAGGVVSSLLSLMGEDVDPLTSRPYLLLQAIVMDQWKRGEGLTLEALIGAVQAPELTRIGVMPLESFYPAKERQELALKLNGLIASPQWARWQEGEPMDIDAMLYTPEGKPRVAIVSISHLDERERMMVTTLLLTRLVSWMRRQPGQSALRAVLYMDEIAGFFPPVAAPPSKAPMLTLLKQARAYGLGVVLATQNPADLDYKALSNMGTWFIGRLQTAQDRERLATGLAGSAGVDEAELMSLLSKLPARTFYVHNVHASQPALFTTRWTMSYLAGPLMGAALQAWNDAARGRDETEREGDDTAGAKEGETRAESASVARDPASVPPAREAESPWQGADEKTLASQGVLNRMPPVAPEGMIHYYVLNPAPAHYVAKVLGQVDVFYEDEKAGVKETRSWGYWLDVPMAPEPAEWANAVRLAADAFALSSEKPESATFGALPEGMTKTVRKSWEKRLKDYVYAYERLPLLYDGATKLYQRSGESEKDFALRVDGERRRLRDEQMAKLKETYAKKLERLTEKVRKAELAVDREQSQADAARQSTWVNVGSAILGGLLGRKAISRTNLNQAGRSMRSLSRQKEQETDVKRAEENVLAAEEAVRALEEELEGELRALQKRFDETADEWTQKEIKPRKADIAVRDLLLVWVAEEEWSGERKRGKDGVFKAHSISTGIAHSQVRPHRGSTEG